MEKNNNVLKTIASYIILILITFCIMLGLYQIVLPVRVNGESMIPNFLNNDRVVVYKKAYNEKQPKRGDVVVAYANIDGERTRIIKRVIGTPGDKIEFKDKHLYINGEEITSPENINGKVFLYIYAKDALGNETVLKSNEFNIDITKPKVVGVENENSYNDSVTITVIDGNIGTIILEKDGTKIEGYANGKEIIEEGTYRLTASDKAGNATIVSFIIKYNRGDIDINNNIDTGDVLALLRYIAQNTSKNVAERHPDWNFNEKNKIIGDVNKNGIIDTGDVLTLQRYQAAKSSKTIAEKHPEWLNIN